MQRMKWLPMVLWAAACGSSPDESNDDSSSSGGDTGDPTTAPSTTDSPTTSPTTTTAMTMTDPATDTTDASSSSGAATTVDPDSSSGEGTTGGGSLDCIGLTQYGSLGTVLAREGTTLDEPVCDATPAPCGGELVDTWTSTTTCGFEQTHNPFAEDCPSSTFTVTSLEVSGTLSFADDGTFAQAFTSTRMVAMNVDAQTCYGATCSDLVDALAAVGELMCTGPDTACECTITTEGDNAVDGTYEIVDDSFVLTVDGQVSLPYPFCVTDDRLDMWSPLAESELTDASCDEVADCEAALGDDYDGYACVDASG